MSGLPTPPSQEKNGDLPSVSADLPDPWGWFRGQMPVVGSWAYLDHAAVGPLSSPAAAALTRFARQAATDGDVPWPSWAESVEQLRRRVARWLGGVTEGVTLLPNTTTGINAIAEGFPFHTGDNLVVPANEFSSNLLPWLNQRRRGVEVRCVEAPAGRVTADLLRPAVDGRTRLIALSWVGYATGYRVDVDAILQLAHDHQAVLFLDAIQALGPCTLDLQKTPVDFLVADGHKWMLGPEGAAIAYFQPHLLDRVHCGTVGWHSLTPGEQFAAKTIRLADAARRFEGGSLNMAGFIALAASLEMFWHVAAQHSTETIQVRWLERAAATADAVRRGGGVPRYSWPAQSLSGIVMFDCPNHDPQRVRRHCLEHGVVLSVRERGLRASTHLYNDQEDLDRLSRALRSLH
jgi:selenocysteine lyase/cysteine desulfurase